MANSDYQRLIDAQERQDGASYTRLCDQLGVDVDDIPLYERGQQEIADEESTRGTLVPRSSVKGFDLDYFGEQIQSEGILPESDRTSPGQLMELLRDSGLSSVYGTPLSDLTPSRIRAIARDKFGAYLNSQNPQP